MTQTTIDILGLNAGIPSQTDEYPAVDIHDPAQSPQGSTKKYSIASLFELFLTSLGIINLPPSNAASTLNYNATYNNGVGGINATLTDASGAFAPFVIDGINGVLNNVYLIKNQINQEQNGIYFLQQNGDGISIPWRLMRTAYFNSPSNIINGEITIITGGATQNNTIWQLSCPPIVVVGTTHLVFNLFNILNSAISIPVTVPQGGTGITSVAAHDLLVGNGVLPLNQIPPSAVTGVPLISQGVALDPTYGTAEVAGGGTGDTSFTPFSVVCGGINPTANLQSVVGLGALNQILTSNGPGVLPTWQTNAASGQVNPGLVNEIAYYAVAGSTLSGLVTAINGLLVTSNTGVPSILAGSGVTGQVLQSNAAAPPSFSTAKYPSSTTINRILYSSANNVVSEIAALGNATLVSNVGGVPSMSQTLPLAVQSNITQLGVQTQQLNMGNNLIIDVLDPASAQDAATKNYVDTQIAAFAVIFAARLASTVALTASYLNGIAGQGATLTNAGAMVALSLDSVPVVLNDLVLIKDQATTFENGYYKVTNIGSGATNWELTRAIDYDQPSEIKPGNLFVIAAGSTLAGTTWIQTATVTNIGVDPILFSQYSAALPIPVPSGGTGRTSITLHNLIVGAGASAVTLLPPSASSGVALVSKGVGSDPAYDTVVVGGGGTGDTSFTAFAVICGGTTPTSSLQSVASVGVAGQVLTSNGAGALPTFQPSNVSFSKILMFMGA